VGTSERSPSKRWLPGEVPRTPVHFLPLNEKNENDASYLFRNFCRCQACKDANLEVIASPWIVSHHLYTFYFSRRREDLIEKALQDIPTFDRATAEAEIDKFLLDAEMLDLYIRFQKAVEEDPEFSVPEERKPGPFEQILSFQNIVLLYAGYFFFVAARDKFRRYVAEQESLGEWKGTNIQFIDDWIDKTRDAANAALEATSEAATSSTDAATNVGEALQSVSDTISDAASSGMAAFFHF